MKQHYPDQEERLSREACTRRLVTMCEKLDKSGILDIPQKLRMSPDKIDSISKVEAMWVYGSYARGALDCGDIDVIVKIKNIEGPPPTVSSLVKNVWGGLSRVRIYLGDPNEERIKNFAKDAKLVWQEGMDWKSAIESIAPNPSAGRYARKSDEIPFRNEQIGMYLDEMEKLVDMKNEGILSWKFFGISEIEHASNDVILHERNKNFSFMNMERGSKDILDLAPYIIGYVESRLRTEPNSTDWRYVEGGDHRNCQFGGTMMRQISGRPPVELLEEISCNRLVLFPKLDKRGPNGFWVIERGPNHPVVKTFENTSAWVIESSSGRQLINSYENGMWNTFGTEIFRSKEYCDIFVKEINRKNSGNGFPAKNILLPSSFRSSQLRGKALLDRLSLSDMIFCEGKGYGCNLTGAVFLRRALGENLDPAPAEFISSMFKGEQDLVREKKISSTSRLRP